MTGSRDGDGGRHTGGAEAEAQAQHGKAETAPATMNTMFSFSLYVSVLKCTYSLPQAATKKQTHTDPQIPKPYC